MFWIFVISWFLSGYATYRWFYLYITNRFKPEPVFGEEDTGWWIIFHAFILLGPLYFIAWVIYIVTAKATQGTNFLGNPKS